MLEREEWSFEKFFDLFIDLGREMMRWMPEDLQIISPTGETLLLLTGIFLHTLFYLIKAAMESLLVISAKAFISHLTSLEKRAKNMSANDVWKVSSTQTTCVTTINLTTHKFSCRGTRSISGLSSYFRKMGRQWVLQLVVLYSDICQ